MCQAVLGLSFPSLCQIYQFGLFFTASLLVELRSLPVELRSLPVERILLVASDS